MSNEDKEEEHKTVSIDNRLLKRYLRAIMRRVSPYDLMEEHSDDGKISDENAVAAAVAFAAVGSVLARTVGADAADIAGVADEVADKMLKGVAT